MRLLINENSRILYTLYASLNPTVTRDCDHNLLLMLGANDVMVRRISILSPRTIIQAKILHAERVQSQIESRSGHAGTARSNDADLL